MVDIQTVSIAIASAGVFLAAIYYIVQIKHQNKVRQTDLVMRLYATFSSNEFQDAYEKVRKGASDFQRVDNPNDLDQKVGVLKFSYNFSAKPS